MVNLGVRFQAEVPGTIIGVRFYRDMTFEAAGYPVSIWDEDGTLLTDGQATIGQNPSTGSFTAPLNASVEIEAGQTYVASYLAPTGR